MLSVVLCTYNGERYLKDQLDSIGKQLLLPDELVVSDDGSHDDSMSIIRDFAKHISIPVRIFQKKRAKGVVHNFSDAIGYSRGNYIALCDQDDVWMPEKLAISMEMLKKGEAIWGEHIPLLVHTDLQVTDKELECIHPSMFMAQHLRNEPDMEQAFRVLLTQNYVTGCTIVMNRALVHRACPIPQEAAVHDWWLALFAAATGHILFVDQPTIKYRQHGSNQVGARAFISMANVKKLFSFRQIKSSMERALRQDYAFLERIGEGHEAGVLVQKYFEALSRKVWNPSGSLGIHMQDMSRNYIFKVFLFLWREHFSCYLSNLKKRMD